MWCGGFVECVPISSGIILFGYTGGKQVVAGVFGGSRIQVREVEV